MQPEALYFVQAFEAGRRAVLADPIRHKSIIIKPWFGGEKVPVSQGSQLLRLWLLG